MYVNDVIMLIVNDVTYMRIVQKGHNCINWSRNYIGNLLQKRLFVSLNDRKTFSVYVSHYRTCICIKYISLLSTMFNSNALNLFSGKKTPPFCILLLYMWLPNYIFTGEYGFQNETAGGSDSQYPTPRIPSIIRPIIG